ncbi:MAG TPA: ATP12 family protein [Kaistiaceae bacterium]|nr:ATP12 family protein [Kaistiaceae bacterium]
MRELFEIPDHEPDPVKRAQAQARRQLPKRFYATAGTVPTEAGHAVALDGRIAHSPGKRPLAFADPAIAEALAAEWAAQGEVIDPATMPLTRLANSAIDGVAEAMEEVAAEIVRYGGTDLVCYRAEGPEKLVARQNAHWDPLVAFARDRLGAPLRLAAGVIHVEQDETTLAAIHDAVDTAAAASPLRLAALHVITTLSGSAIIALAFAAGVLDEAGAWEAAHVDEDHQAETWGVDAEAMARRAMRAEEFAAAVRLFTLTPPAETVG